MSDGRTTLQKVERWNPLIALLISIGVAGAVIFFA